MLSPQRITLNDQVSQLTLLFDDNNLINVSIIFPLITVKSAVDN